MLTTSPLIERKYFIRCTSVRATVARESSQNNNKTNNERFQNDEFVSAHKKSEKTEKKNYTRFTGRPSSLPICVRAHHTQR